MKYISTLVQELEYVVAEEKRRSSQSVREIIQERTFYIPQLITSSLFIFQAMSGCDILAYYNGIIFKEAAVAPEYAAIIFQLTITLGYLLSSLLQTKLDCRTINIIFLTSTALAMLGMSLSFLYPDTLGSSLSLPCLILAGVSYGLGVGPVPFILMSTLLTQKNKTLGVALAQTTRALVVLVQMKMFPLVLTIIGTSGVFLWSTCVCAAGALFSFYFVPVTRNKSIYELETMFEPETT